MTLEGAGDQTTIGRGDRSLDPAEVAKFEALAARWWDPKGPMAPLHAMNPARLDYAVERLAAHFRRDRRAPRPLEGLRLLDLGCGAGLLSEPLARLGAAVTGADPAPGAVEAARLHAAEGGLAIDYRAATAEDVLAQGARFDAVLALEVIEHVSDPAAFLGTLRALLAPGGMLVLSTLNRTARSYALAILGAEVALRWLPRGTHDWRRFVTPEELDALLRGAGLRPLDRMGLVFDPLRWAWRLSERDLAVNYAATAVREG